MDENNQPKRDDFSTKNFIERNQHNRDINAIKKRLSDLESMVGDKDSFIKTFAETCNDSTKMQDAITKCVDKHDSHKIKITFMSAGQFLLNAAAGAFVAWLVIQAILIPQYSIKIDTLQQEIDNMRQSQP